MKKSNFIKPTDTELEILSILWREGQATVGAVHKELSQSKGKKVVYTTTLKLLQLMLDKGLVSRNTSLRAHYYAPSMDRQIAQKHYLNKMLDTVFSGSAGTLVLQAIGSDKISKDEILAIKKLIREKEKETKK